ncbi:MAG: FtsQ-type POTRA domain-containing protein [Halioglobus sp.]
MLPAKSPKRTEESVKRRRKPVKGATRKLADVKKPVRSFAWVNRLMVLVGLGVVLAALFKSAVVLHQIPVERIVVTGQLKNTQTEAVENMVQPALVGGFLSADLEEIRDQLQSLPWVFEATVRRQWPNALEITVTEQLPIARWGEAGFLNHEGQVFEPTNASRWDDLPRLHGEEGSEQTLIDSYQFLSETLSETELEVRELALDGRGQLQAVLTNNVQIALGAVEWNERLERFVTLHQSGLDYANVQTVDTRYTSSIAVAFREIPALAGL